MTLIKHELKQGRLAFIIWTVSISFLMMVCVFLFPEMKKQMESVGNIFATMGKFTEAFGMDQLDFGTLIGFYAIECGNIIGLGGAFYASLTGAAALAKEEKDKTAEFLLTRPVNRTGVITSKFLAVIIQILGLNLLTFGCSALAMFLTGEAVPWTEVILMHTAYLCMQLELGCVCFGISAFLRKSSAGAGVGLAVLCYFLNLLANMSDTVDYLKYATPFAYCEGSEIVANMALDGQLLMIGGIVALVGILAAYLRYWSKDIHI